MRPRQKVRQRPPRHAAQSVVKSDVLEVIPQWTPNPNREGLPRFLEIKDAIDFERIEIEHGLPPATRARLELLAGDDWLANAWVVMAEIAIRRPWLLVAAIAACVMVAWNVLMGGR